MFLLAALSAVLVQTPSQAAPQAAPAGPAPALVFHGRVVAQESGEPIAGARAELRWNRGRAVRSRSHGETRQETVELAPFPGTTSGADGRFLLEYETKFDPWIVVTAPGRGAVACGVLAGHEDPARALVFDLPRAARLELGLERDADSAGADPWAGLEALVEAPLWPSSRPPWAGVTSDAERLRFRPGPQQQGLAFTLDGLPPGVPLTITFTRAGVAAGGLEEIVLAPGETRRMSWMPASPTVPPKLRVVVRDPLHAPIAAVPVLLERRTDERVVLTGAARALRKLTEADGSATWTDLRPGRHVVGVGEDRGGSLFAPPTSVQLTNGGQVDVEFLARPGRRLRGRVVDAWGKGLEGAVVTFTGRVAQKSWSVATRTVENGRYELGPVPRDGAGVLKADHPTVAGLAASSPLKSGAEPEELRLPAPGRVYVSVFDADGSLCAAQIRADSPSALGALWRGFTESEATLERPAGPLVVSVFTVDGRAAWGNADVVEGASSELDLVLQSAGQLRLRHHGPARLLDVTLAGANDRVLGVTTLIAGVDEVVLVPPGEWTVKTADGVRAIRAEPGVELLVEL